MPSPSGKPSVFVPSRASILPPLAPLPFSARTCRSMPILPPGIFCAMRDRVVRFSSAATAPHFALISTRAISLSGSCAFSFAPRADAPITSAQMKASMSHSSPDSSPRCFTPRLKSSFNRSRRRVRKTSTCRISAAPAPNLISKLPFHFARPSYGPIIF